MDTLTDNVITNDWQMAMENNYLSYA